MSFTNGILNLTNWTGNVILPTLAALFIAIAILRFSRGESSTHAMYGGFLFLMVSGLLRAMETFASQRAWSDPDVRRHTSSSRRDAHGNRYQNPSDRGIHEALRGGCSLPDALRAAASCRILCRPRNRGCALGENSYGT